MNVQTAITVSGVTGYIDEKGLAWLHLEDVARGLGFTRMAVSGNEVVRWERVDSYLMEIEKTPVPTCGHDGYIPENVFYRLAMKAKNEIAEAFQAKVADEILPQIRKTGSYSLPSSKNVYGILRGLVDDLERQDQAIAAVNQRVNKIAQGIPALPVPESAALEYVTPTQIGRMFSPRMSGIETNLRLQFAGLQYRVGGEWVPSDKGKDYVKTLPVQLENGKCVYQLHWQRRIFDMICEVMP
jgi:hypothetical protein